MAVAFVFLGSIQAFSSQIAPPGQKEKPTPLQMVQTAHTLFTQGDYESARRYYLEVLPSFPKNFDILRNLAFCYFTKGPRGYADAAKYYRQAHALNPQSPEVTNQLVKCLLGLNLYKEAAGILRGLAEAPNAPPEAWKNLAKAYDAADMLPEAEAAYDAYLQRNPGDLEARTSLGNVYGRHQEYDAALEQFRIVLSSNPNFRAAMLGMAKILSWRNQFDDSLALYDRILRLAPDDGEAASGKAFVLLWMGRADEAQAQFEKLHRRFPHDSDIARGLESANAVSSEKQLTAAERSGNLTRMEALYRQRLAKNPRDLEALRNLATMTATPERCVESIDFSRRATELAPGDASFELLLAKSLSLCQQYSESVARYQKYLESNPKAEAALYDLGTALARARRPAEAIEVFRKLLELNPKSADGTLGLAQALAATGSFQEALLRYDQALKLSPSNYDALQGKAFVLFWTEHFEEARAIFQTLAAKRPSDPQNKQSLQDIAKAEETARWVALRPQPGASAEEFLRYYEKRLASYPDDETALKAVPYLQAELKNNPAAIEGYRRVVEKYPDDRAAKMELARLLATEGKYDESIAAYHDVLKATPEDPAALDALARDYVWANQAGQALPIYKRLLEKNPGNTGYQMEVARLELATKDYPAARDQFASLVSADPENRAARLELAYLDQTMGQTDDSLKNYNELLKQNPRDPDALLGKAQITYYQGKLPEAESSASAAATERPKDFDTLLLMANIEHARGHRKQARAWLSRAAQVTAGNPEVNDLRNRLHDESAVTMHTSLTALRELGPAGGFVGGESVVGGQPLPFEQAPGLFPEDVRVQTYTTTIGYSPSARLDSYFSFTSIPTQSTTPSICCAAAPWSFVFRSSFQASKVIRIRGGVGFARFGPSAVARNPFLVGPNINSVLNAFGKPVLESLPGVNLTAQPSTGMQFTPVAMGGLTISLSKKINLDFDWLRSPEFYLPTPVAMKNRLTENRFTGSLTASFTPRTTLHLEYFYSRMFTDSNVVSDTMPVPGTLDFLPLSQPCPGGFVQASANVAAQRQVCLAGNVVRSAGALHELGHGGSAVFKHIFVSRERFALDGGYSGILYGYSGAGQGFSLGFFDPKFYQDHKLTARIYGKLFGPVGYDFSGGIGLQQLKVPENGVITFRYIGGPLTRSSTGTAGFSLKVSSRQTLKISYTHYNTVGGLGALGNLAERLRGNVFSLTSDWKF